MRRRWQGLPILLVVALTATLLAPVAPVANAQPDTSELDRLQDELSRLESAAAERRSELGQLDDEASRLSEQQARAQERLEEIEAELSLAVERYNETVVALETVQAALEETTSELAELQTEIDALALAVSGHARLLHKLGPSMELSVLMGTDDVSDIGFRTTSLRQIISADQLGVESLTAATDRATALQARLSEQEAEAAELSDQVAVELQVVEQTYEDNAEELADLESTLASTREELSAQQQLVDADDEELAAARSAVDTEQERIDAERDRIRREEEAERERRAEAQRQREAQAEQEAQEAQEAQAEQESAPQTTASEPEPEPAPTPSTRSSASVAVQTALDQVGKPYQWGATGPGSFDCSGLTSFAWRAAGVNIPRTSGAQFSGLRNVSRSQLQPGDLVFYNSPISHVAMYVGGGQIVEASRSGIPVRTATLANRNPVGYARP